MLCSHCVENKMLWMRRRIIANHEVVVVVLNIERWLQAGVRKSVKHHCGRVCVEDGAVKCVVTGEVPTKRPIEENAWQEHPVVLHCRQGAGGSSGSCSKHREAGPYYRIQGSESVGMRAPLRIPE